MTGVPSFLSVVIPVYNEQENLEELFRRLASVFDQLNFDQYEAILISDGSTDGSEFMIADFARRDPRFRGIFLTRNFGHQAALSVGLENSRGTVIAVLDGDLQDPPEEMILLLAAIEAGADVAYGVRRRRKEGSFKRLAYWGFYRVFRLISSILMPLDAGDFCCMTRRVLDAMLKLPETRRFVRGLRAWVGYHQVGVEYERHERFAGAPKYSLRQLVQLAYDGFFSFSSVPVRLMQFLGLFTVGLAVFVGFIYLLVSLLTETPKGFPTLMLSIWFLGGVQMLFLGLLGEYVYRTFEESRRRPTAVIRQVVPALSIQSAHQPSL